MSDEKKNSKYNSVTISDKTFIELFPIDPSLVEDIRIITVPVSVRVKNILMHNGIKTVADLCKMKVNDFISLHGSGKKCYEDICAFLSELSNGNMEFPDVGKRNCSTTQIVIDNIEDILNRDFAFCEHLPVEHNDRLIIDKYKEAVEILGTDLAWISYKTPNKITPLMDAFDSLIKAQRELEYRKNKTHEAILLISEQRRNNYAYGYINAFTNNDYQRNTLYKIYSLESHPRALVKDFKLEIISDSVSDFKLLLDFLKWCSFDIDREISELFKILYGKSNNIQEVIRNRAAGDTLGMIGDKMGITRERVRQIELKAKRIFNFWQNQNRVLSKISAERNGDTVLSSLELSDYFGDRYAEMAFLLRNSESATYYYDSQLDVFVLGDESISTSIEHIIDALPDAFDERKYDSIINEAEKEQGIPRELLEKAICDEFQKDGATWHRTHLSLTAIYTEILEKYYPDGIDIYSENELQVFRYIASEEFGCTNLPNNNRAISARLSEIGILCGRGKYRTKKKAYISKELASKIHQYIAESPAVIFMTNTLYSVFEEELLQFGIDNKYYLQGVLRELYGSEFVFRRDYISKDESVTSLYVEIIQYIKRYSHPITKNDIKNAFPGVTEIVISFATSDISIINLFGSYIHRDKLNLSDSDKMYFEGVLHRFISNNGAVIHYKNIYDFIEHDNSDLLRKIYVNFPTNLFSVLESLFKDKYQFKRPFIADIDTDIGNPEEQLRDLVANSETIEISDIIAFAKENNYAIYSILELINSFNETHLLISRDTLATLEYIGINENIAKEVLSALQGEIVDTVLVTSLECIYKLPKLNVPWTEWLVYAVVNRYGESIEVGTTSNQFRLSVPIIAPKGKLNREKFDGVSVDTTASIAQADDLDNIDDLISDFIELDFDEDLI